LWLLLPMWIASASAAMAGDEPTKDPSVLERIGNTAKKVGNKIEQGFTKAGRKLEEKKVGEKIEQKLKKAANKTAEGFKKAGDKIGQKLNN
jgi:F0F1-type ATP synthase membrane subunit b/b'